MYESAGSLNDEVVVKLASLMMQVFYQILGGLERFWSMESPELVPHVLEMLYFRRALLSLICKLS